MSWTKEILLVNSKDFETQFQHLIESAQFSIDLSTYIFSSDEFAQKILELLKAKAQHSIRVRLLVDGVGSLTTIKLLRQSCGELLQLKVYHPLPRIFYNFSLRNLFAFRNFFRLLYLSNRRNHQKLLLIDGKTALVGSHNITHESLEWRESSILVSGKHVKTICAIFEYAWRRPRLRDLNTERATKAIRKDRYVLHNTTSPFRLRHNRTFYRRLQEAQKHIWITTPYFLPPPKILYLLMKKARAGVDVRLLLPQVSDVRISKWLAESFYNELLKCGIRIYEYKKTILHAKGFILDDWATVGSSNLNYRSLFRDLELDIVLRDSSIISKLKQQFLTDINCSNKIDPKKKARFSLLKFILVRALSLFKGSM